MAKAKKKSEAERLADQFVDLPTKDRRRLIAGRLQRLINELEDEGYEIKLELIYDQ